jgi:hypothetical protein
MTMKNRAETSNTEDDCSDGSKEFAFGVLIMAAIIIAATVMGAR